MVLYYLVQADADRRHPVPLPYFPIPTHELLARVQREWARYLEVTR